MSDNIIVTTGIYDAIKDTLRRKKVTVLEEKRLAEELRKAKQVLRRDLPSDVVTVDRKVTIKDHTQNFEHEYIFVTTTKAKPAKNKIFNFIRYCPCYRWIQSWRYHRLAFQRWGKKN